MFCKAFMHASQGLNAPIFFVSLGALYLSVTCVSSFFLVNRGAALSPYLNIDPSYLNQVK